MAYATGRSQLVDAAAPRAIPAGTYDCGDGYFDPAAGCVRTYEGGELRTPGTHPPVRG